MGVQSDDQRTLTGVTTAAAGTYTCDAGGTTTNVPGVLTVNKAQAIVTLSRPAQMYDGTPKAVSVMTVPAGLPVIVSYAGSATPPAAPGSYAVIAAVNHPTTSARPRAPS